jgi:hypothetical protein
MSFGTILFSRDQFFFFKRNVFLLQVIPDFRRMPIKQLQATDYILGVRGEVLPEDSNALSAKFKLMPVQSQGKRTYFHGIEPFPDNNHNSPVTCCVFVPNNELSWCGWQG